MGTKWPWLIMLGLIVGFILFKMFSVLVYAVGILVILFACLWAVFKVKSWRTPKTCQKS